MNMSHKKPVLYLTRNGLLEPLGQSQVMSYLLAYLVAIRLC